MHKQLNHQEASINALHRSRRELFESTKLSKLRSSLHRDLSSAVLFGVLPESSESPVLPELSESSESNAPLQLLTASIETCRVCENENLEADNGLQQRTKVCRKCIDHYSQVDSAFNQAADEKTKAAKIAIIAGRLKFDE